MSGSLKKSVNSVLLKKTRNDLLYKCTLVLFVVEEETYRLYKQEKSTLCVSQDQTC